MDLRSEGIKKLSHLSCWLCRIRREMSVVAVAFAMSVCATAQNNPYKIDDRLYPLYEKADSARFTDDGLKFAEELKKQSVKLGDKKAECLAYTIAVNYHQADEIGKLKAAVDDLKEISRKNGYLQYFYFGWVVYINQLCERGNTYDALQEASKLRKQAEEDKHPYGISTGYRMIGNLYWARGEIDKSFAHYKAGLEYSKKNVPEQDHMAFYAMMARCHDAKNEYAQAVEIADEGMKQSKSDRSRIGLMVHKALSYAYWGKTDEMLDVYGNVKEMLKTVDIGEKSEYYQLEAHVAIARQDYALAHHYAEKMDNESDKNAAQMFIYIAEGDWKAAYECKNRQYEKYIAETSKTQSSDFAKISSMFENERLKAEKQELAARTKQTLYGVGVFILVLLLINLAWFRHNATKFIKQLKQKNEELRIARDKAEESERLKTQFVQNVSHEIRTPLNAIVGFSDLVLNPDMEIGNDEKAQFKQLIHKNSDLLASLVNDVLVLSELQSGKANAHIGKCYCNNLCRTSLATVDYRRPEGVEMRFTTDLPDDLTIDTDERRVMQVLVNFLTNAEKYTAEGSITLDCSQTKMPGYVTFTVTDTGCGIPKEKQKQVFDRFEKLDDFHQGMGLGLNICALIAGLLNAKIGIDSNYTDGARFYFAIAK